MTSPVLPYFMQQKWEAANNHDGDACFDLGEYFYAQKDYAQAFAWYQKAAQAPEPNPNAFFNLGYAYQYGEGTPQDMIAAFDCYQKAAELDLPQALNNLAYFYEAGIVVERDIEKADNLMRRATALMNNLQTELYKARRENKHLLSTQQAQAQAQAKLEARALQAEARLEDLQQSSTAAQQANKALKATQAELEKQLKEAQRQLTAVQAELKEAQQQAQRYQERYGAMQTACQTLQKKLTDAEAENSTQKQAQEEQAQEFRRLSEALQTEQASRETLQSSLSAEQSHVAALKQAGADHSRKLLQQTKEIQVLQEANQQLLGRKPFLRKPTLLLWTDLYVVLALCLSLFYPLTQLRLDTPFYLISGILLCLTVLGFIALGNRKYILFALIKICVAAAYAFLVVVLFEPFAALERLALIPPLLWETVHAFRKEKM